MSDPCTAQSCPPFPSNIPLAKLRCISLSNLLINDKDELDSLLTSCRVSGFFFLDLRGVAEGEALLRMNIDMFNLGAALLNQEKEEKMRYALQEGTTHGYLLT